MEENTISRRFLNFLDRHMGVIFVIPGALILSLIIVYPIITNITLSFTDSHLIYGTSRFVGFENYLKVLSDPGFLKALRLTLVWTILSVSLQLILGLGSALLLNAKKVRGVGIFRTLIFIPYTLPIIVVSLIWRWMLNRFYGVGNWLLMALGIIEQPLSWFGSSSLAFPSIIAMNVWFGYPLMTLSILAGLQTIPEEFYEVAKIEGANWWETLKHVILPSIRRVIGIMVILRTIWTFNSFDMTYTATGGGPGQATRLMTLYGYNLGWERFWVGQASALSVILLLILTVLIIVFFRLFNMEGE